MSKLGIPYPEKRVFQNNLTEMTQVTQENQPLFFIDRVEYPEEGGIYVYKFGGELAPVRYWLVEPGKCQFIEAETIKNRVDLLYPEKGFPFPEAVIANNTVKRFLINQITLFASRPFLPFLLLFLILPYQMKIKALDAWIKKYIMFCKLILTPYYMQDSYYMTPTKEIRKFIEYFMEYLGFRPYIYEGFAKIFAHIIEYDTAYRYRIEDILSETTKNRLTLNPRQEIQRLVTLFSQREPNIHTQNKFISFAKILGYMLYLPKIRYAFVRALSYVTFDNLQMDAADRYYTLKMDGYNFGGKTLEERYPEYLKMHHGNPPSLIQIGAFDTGKPKSI